MASGTITINRVSGNVIVSTTTITGTVSTSLTSAKGLPVGTMPADAGKFVKLAGPGPLDYVLAAGGAGGGSVVSIKGTEETEPDFNDTLPAAPTNFQNVKWQVDTNGKVSAYIPDPLKGDQGDPGTPGAAGDDGREIELQKTATHVQWRYVGDVSWTDLIALTDITGPAGSNGTNGTDGADGTSFIGSVNGTAKVNVDFDDSTPAAPAGGTNGKWQSDSSTPANVSLYLDWGSVIRGWIEKPVFEMDCIGTGPWAQGTRGGTWIGQYATDGNHPGVYQFQSNTNQYSGCRLEISGNAFQISGGERSTVIAKFSDINDVLAMIGFADNDSNHYAIAIVTDGAFIWIDTNGLAVGVTSANTSQTTTGTSYQLSENQDYIFTVIISSDASRCDFYIHNADTLAELWHDYNTTNIPTGAGRQTGHYVSCYCSDAGNARETMLVDKLIISYDTPRVR